MRILLSGGGTGGHIFPALAIAGEIKKRFPSAEFLFVGAEGKMEMQRVPKVGYPIVGLPIRGLQRKLSLSTLAFPFRVIYSLYKAYKLIKRFQPDVVIGTGGYASAPTLKAAQLLGIPYFIQEQNSYAGVTNKWVAKGAKGIFVAYDHMERYFPSAPLFLTGNPIREDLMKITHKAPEAYKLSSLAPQAFTLFVIGGSLGARKINELVKEHLPLFQEKKVQVLWQCGAYYFPEYKHLESESVRILPFVEDMKAAFSLADVIIARAGASSVSELSVVGKPVIFVPSPNVAEDHQTKNAQAIADQNAALLLKETDITTHFTPLFTALLCDENKRKELSENFRKLARPHATQEIVDKISEKLKVKSEE